MIQPAYFTVATASLAIASIGIGEYYSRRTKGILTRIQAIRAQIAQSHHIHMIDHSRRGIEVDGEGNLMSVCCWNGCGQPIYIDAETSRAIHARIQALRDRERDKVQADIRAIANAPDRFVCPKCGAVSFNANDIEHGYCGRCHDFTRETRA